ncbi:MAG: DsbC family protein [Nitrospirae bacterium]|nr:DsbC family protein [Nitrospirota bacterium]
MKKVLLFAVLIFLLLPVLCSLGLEEKSKNTSDSSILSSDEALSLLSNLDPNIKVIEVRKSPVENLWEVDIQTGGRKTIVYIDSSKKYMILGAINSIQEKKNLTQERITELNKVDVSKIPLGDAIVMGDEKAKYRVIVFTDPDCPYCARLHQELKKVIEQRKDIAFFIKMFPLKIHPSAYDKAKTIVCEKSLTLLDDAFDKKELPKPKCESTAVDDNIKLSEELGITGTPALILPDGRVMPGYKKADAIIGLIGS